MTMGVFVQVNEASAKCNSNPIGYIICEDGCWEWIGAKTRKGYGTWNLAGSRRPAHRVMYEKHRGPIPDGLQIDHLCRKRDCVNPDHMEPVTTKENTLRGTSPSARCAAQTSCVHGHPFDEINTIKTRNGARVCRECMRRRGREYQRRLRMARHSDDPPTR